MFTFFEVVINSIINRIEIRTYARNGVSKVLCKLNNFENKSHNFGRKIMKLFLKGTVARLVEKNIRYVNSILPS